MHHDTHTSKVTLPVIVHFEEEKDLPNGAYIDRDDRDQKDLHLSSDATGITVKSVVEKCCSITTPSMQNVWKVESLSYKGSALAFETLLKSVGCKTGDVISCNVAATTTRTPSDNVVQRCIIL